MTNNSTYPVVDLFAGPGGLGEGFASMPLLDQSGFAFKIALSIEKDSDAYRTLKLRHFFRAFLPGEVAEDYYKYLQGEIGPEKLYELHPEQATQAEHTAWRCELGEEPHETVRARILRAIDQHRKWVLVGGPPCQAYSQVGRSRMKNDPNFENDPRHFLYREYLRILADHLPPVFVMENVKGLLSATVRDESVVQSILRDLQAPRRAIYSENHDDKLSQHYTLYSLSESGAKDLSSDPGSFLVKAEKYGIPQARHRVFIVGVRSDIPVTPEILSPTNRCTVRDAIGDLPPLRSRLSRGVDDWQHWIETLKSIQYQAWFENVGTNGRAALIHRAEQVLATIGQTELKTKETNYHKPSPLSAWYRDDRLTVLTSHEARAHMESDLHRYFFASLYAQINEISPRLRDLPQQLLPDHENIKNAQKNAHDKVKYDFDDRYCVQLANSPATIITSHIAKDGHYFIERIQAGR